MNDDIHSVDNMRVKRAIRFANQVIQIMKDYIPRDCLNRAFDYLYDEGLEGNFEIINVPFECDHLNKLDLEKRMYEAMLKGEKHMYEAATEGIKNEMD